MASGYFSRIGGVDIDFDDLFDRYVTGAPPAATGYEIAGFGDLAGRYAPLIFGTQRADVGYAIQSGADAATVWAAKGTASYVSPYAGLPDEVYALSFGSSAPLTAVATFSLFRNGTTFWAPPDSSAAWHSSAPAGIGDLYDIEFTLQAGGNSAGTLSGDALGVRHVLSAQRGLTLTYTRSSVGALQARRVILAQLRRTGSVTVVGSQTVKIRAEVDIS